MKQNITVKRLLIAVTLVLTLICIFIGVSWYTGQHIERKSRELIEQANQSLKNNQSNGNLWISLDKYERGVFTSYIRYVLHITSTESTEKPIEMRFKDKIEHGPLPLSKLKKMELIPQLAVVHTKLMEISPISPEVKIASGHPLYSAVTNINYSGHISSKMTAVPFEYKKNDLMLQFSGITLTASSIDGENITIVSEQPVEQIRLLNNSIGLELKNTLFNLKQTIPFTSYKAGHYSVSIQEASLNLNNEEKIVGIDQLSISSNSNIENGHYQDNVVSNIQNINVRGKDFGSQELHASIKNINIAAIKSLDNISLFDSDVAPLEKINVVNTILQSNPEINLSSWRWKNSQGESQYQLLMKFQPINKEMILANSPSIESILLSSLKELKTSLNISIPMTKQVLTQALVLKGVSINEANIYAERQLNELKALGSTFKLFNIEGEQIKSSLSYANDVFTLNDKVMSLKELLEGR